MTRLLIIGVFSFLFFESQALALNSVTVLADKSMNMTVVNIARQYSTAKNVVVNTSFVSPENQEAQILEGAAADILITPRAEWIEKLKTQGLVDIYSQMELAKNRLALIGPVDASVKVDLSAGMPVANIIRAMNFEQGFIVGNPQYMADGTFAKEALRNLGAAEYLEEYTLYIKHPEQIAGMVQNRGAFGVAFQSTVRNMQGVRVLDIFPEHTHQPMQYYAVVIAGNNMDEARKFMDYLKSREVRRLLINSGYVVN